MPQMNRVDAMAEIGSPASSAAFSPRSIDACHKSAAKFVEAATDMLSRKPSRQAMATINSSAMQTEQDQAAVPHHISKTPIKMNIMEETFK